MGADVENIDAAPPLYSPAPAKPSYAEAYQMAPSSVPAEYKLVPIAFEAAVPHETHRPQTADTPSLADLERGAEARRWVGGLRDEDLPLITHEEALAVRHWQVGGYRVWRPRTVMEQEPGLRAEDSWYVAREQP